MGLIGGITPEATVEYYRQLVASYRAQASDDGYPSIVINSINLTKLLGFLSAGAFDALSDFLVGGVDKLARAGADFALLTSNTSHIVFEQVRARSTIPLISIVQAACEQARVQGLTRLGLIGTHFTMKATFYADVFAEANISIILPSEYEQTYIHDKYMSELANAVFLPETRAVLMAIAQRLVDRDRIQGLILGGTELPLILGDCDFSVPILDTMRIHVQKAVAQLLAPK